MRGRLHNSEWRENIGIDERGEGFRRKGNGNVQKNGGMSKCVRERQEKRGTAWNRILVAKISVLRLLESGFNGRRRGNSSEFGGLGETDYSE